MQGKGISAGIAIGTVYYYQRISAEIKTYKIIDKDAEWNRFKAAQAKAVEELRELAADVKFKIGEQEAFLFETYQMLAKDFDYEGIIEQIIKEEKLNAETAVRHALEVFTEMFAAMQDAYMRERLEDIKDVSERIIGILNDVMPEYIDSEVPVILLAEDLTPSEMIQLDKTKAAGIITADGSGLSHTAILARAMGIPMIGGLGDDWKEVCHGRSIVMDGETGSIIIEPEEDVVQVMLKKQEQLLKQRALLEQLKGKENVTLDGRKIRISCSISSPEEVLSVHQNDADGIGLFRSEFLYLNRSTYPTEEEQYEAYKKVLSEMKGKEVIVRTCDMGADKQTAYFDLPKEENSAMGFRSLRISLMRQEFFRTQLRALYRASVYGRLGILFPMVTSVWEVREVKNICESVKKELEREGILYSKEIELGIMIETPAAAIISDELAKEVDFFSCGTNDLTQFVLACDRQNPNLECFYDPHHPAVLRLLKMVCENAHANGIRVGICGELGADLELIKIFLTMGVDELSVSPSAVLPLRQAVRAIDIRKKIILTSHGLTTPIGKKLIGKELSNENLKSKRIFLFHEPHYFIEEMLINACLSLGFQRENILLSGQQKREEDILKSDYIYCTEGNTFEIMSLLRERKLVPLFKKAFKNGVVYIGASAGAIIAGESIEEAKFFDKNFTEMVNFEGLCLFDGIVFPHLTQMEFEEFLRDNAHLKEKYQKIYSIGDEECIILQAEEAKEDSQKAMEFFLERRIVYENSSRI